MRPTFLPGAGAAPDSVPQEEPWLAAPGLKRRVPGNLVPGATACRHESQQPTPARRPPPPQPARGPDLVAKQQDTTHINTLGSLAVNSEAVYGAAVFPLPLPSSPGPAAFPPAFPGAEGLTLGLRASRPE